MRFVHISDIHLGATSDAVLGAAQDAIRAQAGAALVVSGDLTQRGTRAEFRGARDWIDGLELPAIVVPGNHDTPLLHAGHRLFKPFARYTDHFGDLTRPLQAGRMHFFPINTARGWQTRANWAEGSVNLFDLDAMISSGEDSGSLPVMVCHHPFTPFARAGLRTRTRRGDLASKRLAKSRFQLLLTGHVHTPHAEWIAEGQGNYLAVSAGTLSLRLRTSPPGFNVLDLDASGVSVTPFSLEQGTFAPSPARRFSWSDAPSAA